MKTNQRAMRSVWHSLLWKEWHEHKWKLVSLTAVLLGVLCVVDWVGEEQIYSRLMLFGTLIPYSVLAGVFLGMSTAGRESGRGTLPFLQSLPVPMWKPGMTKLGVAIHTAVLPMIVFVGVFCIWGQRKEAWPTFFSAHGQAWLFSDWVAFTTVVSVLGVTSLLLWMATAGGNQSDEIRAGAIGFLVISFVWLVFYLLAISAIWLELRSRSHLPDPLKDPYITEHAMGILSAAMPGGVTGALQIASRGVEYWGRYLLLLATGLIGHGFVLTWYLRRFGKVVGRPGRFAPDVTSITMLQHQQLGPPMRSQFTAVAWKQIRETGPLALMAVGGILMLIAAIYLFNLFSDRRIDAREIGEVLGGITLMVCFLVTLVTGIGVFFEDLKPGVDDFWRSRPMNFSLWFSVKFVVGLLVLVVAFGTLMLFAYWLTDASLLSREPEPLLEVAYFGWSFLLIYTLAMATYCLLRQPIYAVILTFGILYGGLFAIGWIHGYFLRDIELHWSIVVAAMLFIQACATTLAWCAVRNDWGWKG